MTTQEVLLRAVHILSLCIMHFYGNTKGQMNMCNLSELRQNHNTESKGR